MSILEPYTIVCKPQVLSDAKCPYNYDVHTHFAHTTEHPGLLMLSHAVITLFAWH